MEPRWLDEREERAWRGFQRLRIELTAHLARQLSQECGLTEADYAVPKGLALRDEIARYFRIGQRCSAMSPQARRPRSRPR